MIWKENDDAGNKRVMIQLLVNLSLADGEMSSNELRYILDVTRIFGIDANEVKSFLINSSEDYQVPSSEIDRMTIIYYLLFLMKVDGKVSIAEENLIYHYGFKLGFNESMLRDLIIVIKQYLGKYLPPTILLDYVKKYLN